jgi:hypothetical protein
MFMSIAAYKYFIVVEVTRVASVSSYRITIPGITEAPPGSGGDH